MTLSIQLTRDGAKVHVHSCTNEKHDRPQTCNLSKKQPFWMPLEMNTLWCFKSVADLCFTGPFAVPGKAKYQYGPLRSRRKMTLWTNRQMDWRTDRRRDATKRIISPASQFLNIGSLGPMAQSRECWHTHTDRWGRFYYPHRCRGR